MYVSRRRGTAQSPISKRLPLAAIAAVVKSALPVDGGIAPAKKSDLLPPCPRRESGQKGEVPMFEMINEEKPSPERRKQFLMKVGIFIVAMALVAGVIYFLATSGT